MNGFDGCVAVVTGGGSGIGRSLALGLASRGAKVVIGDVQGDRAQGIADEIGSLGHSAIGVVCDVTDLASMEDLREHALSRFGSVEVLCNNAGVGKGGTLDATDPNDFAWIFEVNVFGIFNGVKTFVPLLRQAKTEGRFAHILNTASEHSWGIPPWVPPSTAYSASKHAALGLSDGLRRDLLSDGIGVSVLCPSWVATGIWDAGRSRPERFGGAVHAPREYSERLAAIGQDPDLTAQIALEAVLAGEFLILTDPQLASFVEQRHDEFTASLRTLDQRLRNTKPTARGAQ